MYVLFQFDDELKRPRKRSKEETPHEIITTTTVAVDPSGVRPSRAHVQVRRSLNRSFSEPRDINQLAVATPSTPAFHQLRHQQSQVAVASGTLTPGRYLTSSAADL
jgi:hypothetical protein